MIRFGLLGCGRIAKRHSDLFGAKLVAVCDEARERAAVALRSEMKMFGGIHGNCSMQSSLTFVKFVG